MAFIDIAAEMREAIHEGYRDLIDGRVVEFKGDLRVALREARRREKQAWTIMAYLGISRRAARGLEEIGPG